MKDRLDEALIRAAMDRNVMRYETMDAVIAVLCGTAAPVQVIDDGLPEYDDGTRALTPEEQFVQDVFNPPKPMVHVPSDAMDAPFVRKRLTDVSGNRGRNRLIAELSGPRNAPVREALALAIILREAYGPAGLWQLVEDHIFDKPEYAAARQDAEPLIRKYACS